MSDGGRSSGGASEWGDECTAKQPHEVDRPRTEKMARASERRRERPSKGAGERNDGGRPSDDASKRSDGTAVQLYH